MKKTLLYTLPLLMMMAFVACSKDGKPTDIERPGDGEDTTRVVNSNFTFSVNLPAQANPNPKSNSGGDGGVSTYAISAQDENAVSTINVLAFKHNVVPDTYTLVDWAEATNIGDATGGTDGNKKTFKVKFSKLIKDSPYQFIIAANAKTEVAELFSTYGITFDAPKDATLALIKLTGVTEWVNTAGAAVRNFPMWGESETVAITENMSIDEVRLLRMVAKINVTVDNNVTVRSDFKLKSVDLYNFNKDGRVVPDAANLASGSKSKVVKPTTNERVHTQGPIPYASSSTEGLSETIYTFESKVPYLTAPNVDLGDVICIVVGGHYKGSSDMSYYRVDIAKKNTTTDLYDYMDILRNHNYKINITKVANNGYDTSLEAFNSRAVNIDVDIEAWDENEVDITFNDQYQLAVNKSHLDFYMEGRAQDISLYTDYPSGWKIEKSNDFDWIITTPANDGPGEKTITVTTQSLLPGSPERIGEFYIVSGNLKKKITVKQISEAELSIDVFPNSLVFRKSGTSAKSIAVTTFPGSTEVFFSEIQGTNPINWRAGTGFPVSGMSNMGTYSFHPDINNSGSLMTSKVTIYVQDALGNIDTRIVTISQLATDLLFEVFRYNPYTALGGSGLTFTVNSDTDWRIASISGTTSMLASGYDNTTKAAGTGTVYTFALNPNNTWEDRSVMLEPASADLDFSGQPIEIIQSRSNPSLVLDLPKIDFGSAVNATPGSLKVTSNAKWKFSTSGNWALAVESTSPLEGDVGGGETFHTTTDNYVAFNPKTWTAAVGTPAAGTIHSGVASFTTQTGATSGEASQSITVSRVVPAFFFLPPVPTVEVLRTENQVTVNVETNAAWKLTPSAGTVSEDQGPTAWGVKSATATIAANTTWSTTTAAVNRTVTISSAYGLTTGAMTTPGESKTVQQPGYYISAITRTHPAIAATGGTSASVSITGAFPAIKIRAAVGDTAVSGEATVAARESGVGSESVTINANDTWAARNVACQYQDPRNSNNWETIATAVSQPGYKVSAQSATAVTASKGGTTTVSLTGYRPAIAVQMLISGTSTVTGTVAAGTATNTTTLLLPANTTTADRTIIVQGKLDGTNYSNIATWTQAGGNIRLSSGRIVAKTSTGPATWAQLMGIPTTYNGANYPDKGQYYYAVDYHPGYGGCAAYSEPGYPEGTWRVPENGEVQEMLSTYYNALAPWVIQQPYEFSAPYVSSHQGWDYVSSTGYTFITNWVTSKYGTLSTGIRATSRANSYTRCVHP